MRLEEVVIDVDKICRKETKELYESEGRADALGSSGVPESLDKWLIGYIYY
jgi:hypothetical protein